MASIWYTWADSHYGDDSTAATTWSTWCNNGTSNSTTDGNIWCSWVVATGTATTTTSDVWNNWTSETYKVVTRAPRELTAEERAEAERRRLEAERKRKEEEEQRKKALAKSMELLRQNLSQKQRDSLDKHGWFLVEGGKSKKTYRIHGRGYSGNIEELEGDAAVARFCVHAEYRIPLGDQLLAQALSIRLDEEHIIGRANVTRLTPAPRNPARIAA